MKIIEGTFVSAEDIIEELRGIRECLDILLTRQSTESGSVVWASQLLLPSVTIPVNRPFAGCWQKP